MKKIVSIALVLMLLTGSICVNAFDLSDSLDVVADELSDFTKEDRKNFMTIVTHLLAIDGGVDTIVLMVDNHNPQSQEALDLYISKVLKRVTKDELKSYLRYIKVIPQEVRKVYFDDFSARKELGLSPEGVVAVDAFMEELYEKSPGVKTIFEEDGVTSGVLANFLKFIPSANDNIPVLSVDKDHNFSPYKVSSSVLTKWNEICAENKRFANINTALVKTSEFLNTKFVESQRKEIAKLLSELKICFVADGERLTFKNAILSNDTGVSYPVIYATFENGKLTFETKSVMGNVSDIVFNDIDGWYKSCITELAYMGVVSGRGDGRFYPNDYVTREEFVKMICSAINLNYNDGSLPFADTDSSSWYYKYVLSAYNCGIINGQSATSFGVGANISRQDVAVICNNIMKNLDIELVKSKTFADFDSVSPYAKESVTALAGYGIINGDNNGNFNPRNSITRAESAKIINEIIYLISNVK